MAGAENKLIAALTANGLDASTAQCMAQRTAAAVDATSIDQLLDAKTAAQIPENAAQAYLNADFVCAYLASLTTTGAAASAETETCIEQTLDAFVSKQYGTFADAFGEIGGLGGAGDQGQLAKVEADLAAGCPTLHGGPAPTPSKT